MRRQSYSTRTFNFRHQLGVGGFGEVYLAELETSEGFSKIVAIKLLRKDAAKNTVLIQRLRQEARMLGQLRHPAIVQAEDLVLLKGRLALVMEYVPGANLNWLMHPQVYPEPLPGKVVLSVVRRVAEALDAASSRPSLLTGEPLHLIHRDIKPSNIRITPDGEVKVLDFGIALSDTVSEQQPGKRLGSLPYMAPESLLSLAPSPATDVYSLGITFFEMIARAHFGRCELQEIAHEQLVEQRIRILNMEPFGGTAMDVADLMGEMLSFQVSARPTAAQVVTRIRDLLYRMPGDPLEDWAPLVVPRVAEVCAGQSDGVMTGAQVMVEDDSFAESIQSSTQGGEAAASVIGTSYWGGGDGEISAAVASEVIEPDRRSAKSAPVEIGGWGLFVAVPAVLLLGLMAYQIWPKQERIHYTPPATALRQIAPDSTPDPGATPTADPGEAAAGASEPAQGGGGEFSVKVIPPSREATFESSPEGIGVQIDGAFRGRTPLQLKLPEGAHEVVFGQGDQYYTFLIQVSEEGDNRWSWDASDNSLR